MKWFYSQLTEVNGQQIFTHSSSSRHYTSKVYTKYLAISVEQEATIKEVYNNGHFTDTVFKALDPNDQRKVAVILASNGLDMDVWESLNGQWSMWWEKARKRGQSKPIGKEQELRVLYQWYVSFFLLS